MADANQRPVDDRAGFYAELGQINQQCESLGVTPIYTADLADLYETDQLPTLVTHARLFVQRKERDLRGCL